MQNAIRSACREEKNKYKNEGEEELPGAGEAMTCCVSGGAVAEAGGSVKRRCGSNDSSKR